MIPKIIHYCWFGGKPLPELACRCIDSWKKFLPDYQIVRWDESTFDVNSNPYVKEAYDNKKYAFVTDYVRLYAMYTQGGIYMDTDVEVRKPLDQFLKHKAFSGFESYHDIPTGIMASEKGFQGVKDQLDYYTDRHFVKDDGTFDLTTNVTTITNYYLDRGLKRNNTYQVLEGYAFYPRIYFCPSKLDIADRLDEIYTIHHMAGSWLDPEELKKKHSTGFNYKLIAAKLVRRIFGHKIYEAIRQHI